MKNRRLRRTFPLAFENLELRLPPAGQVLIALAGNGTLSIVGDGAGNDISLDQTDSGEFTVTGNDGETFLFNGNAFNSGDTINDVTRHVKIDLQGGDDKVSVVGLGLDVDVPATAFNLEIKTGEGSDEVEVANARLRGKLTIDTGEGDDASDDDGVLLSGLNILRSLNVSTGGGDDDLDVSDCLVFGRTTIQTARENDHIDVAGNCIFGRKLVIDAGNADGGTDQVHIDGAGILASKLKIATGSGDDDLRLNGILLKNATIATGSGIDTFTVGDVAVTVGRLQMDLGEGDDQLFFEDASFASRATILAGAGNDTLTFADDATFDQFLLDLGAGDDTIDVANLIVLGPRRSKVSGGAGLDVINGGGNVTGAQFVIDPLTTGVETVNV